MELFRHDLIIRSLLRNPEYMCNDEPQTAEVITSETTCITWAHIGSLSVKSCFFYFFIGFGFIFCFCKVLWNYSEDNHTNTESSGSGAWKSMYVAGVWRYFTQHTCINLKKNNSKVTAVFACISLFTGTDWDWLPHLWSLHAIWLLAKFIYFETEQQFIWNMVPRRMQWNMQINALEHLYKLDVMVEKPNEACSMRNANYIFLKRNLE